MADNATDALFPSTEQTCKQSIENITEVKRQDSDQADAWNHIELVGLSPESVKPIKPSPELYENKGIQEVSQDASPIASSVSRNIEKDYGFIKSSSASEVEDSNAGDGYNSEDEDSQYDSDREHSRLRRKYEDYSEDSDLQSCDEDGRECKHSEKDGEGEIYERGKEILEVEECFEEGEEYSEDEESEYSAEELVCSEEETEKCTEEEEDSDKKKDSVNDKEDLSDGCKKGDYSYKLAKSDAIRERGKEDKKHTVNEQADERSENNMYREDEEISSPTVVPRRTGFWDHDNRFTDIAIEESRQPLRRRQLWDRTEVNRWQHDCYVESEQGPKEQWEIEESLRELQIRQRSRSNRGRRNIGDFISNADMDRVKGYRGGKEGKYSDGFQDRGSHNLSQDVIENYPKQRNNDNRNQPQYSVRDNKAAFDKHNYDKNRNGYGRGKMLKNGYEQRDYNRKTDDRNDDKRKQNHNDQDEKEYRSDGVSTSYERHTDRNGIPDNNFSNRNESYVDRYEIDKYYVAKNMNKSNKQRKERENNNFSASQYGNHSGEKGLKTIPPSLYQNEHSIEEIKGKSSEIRNDMFVNDEKPSSYHREESPSKKKGGRGRGKGVTDQNFKKVLRADEFSREKTNREKRIDQLPPRLREPARERMLLDEMEKGYKTETVEHESNQLKDTGNEVVFPDEEVARDKPKRYSSQRQKPGASVLDIPAEVPEIIGSPYYNQLGGDVYNRNLKVKLLEQNIMLLKSQLQEELNIQCQQMPPQYPNINVQPEMIQHGNMQQQALSYGIEPMYGLHGNIVPNSSVVKMMSPSSEAPVHLNQMFTAVEYQSGQSNIRTDGLYVPPTQYTPQANVYQ